MRICTEQDRSALNRYLDVNPALNLFFIGDIENNGFDSDFQQVYVEEDEQGFHAVYLVYRKNLCIMSNENHVRQDLVDQLIRDCRIQAVNGCRELMEQLSLPEYTRRDDCLFARMAVPNEMVDTSRVERLLPQDAEEIVKIEEEAFHMPGSADGIRHSMKNGSGRVYGVRENGAIAAVAESTAECRNLAMVVGVCTRPQHRRQGYASACITRLSNDLLKEGKTPCLFYDNPDAARIYKALGYEDIGTWSMARKAVAE